MAQVKLVAESLDEHTSQITPIDIEETSTINEQELNESSKGALQKFLKDPEKYPKSFLGAFSAQFSKKGGDKLKAAVSNLDTDVKKKLAQQALNALEDSKKGYAWIKVSNGKITGADAMGVKSGGGLVNQLGRS
jgi:hypothetical protein